MVIMIVGRSQRARGQAQVVGAMLVFSIGFGVLLGLAFLFESMKAKILTDVQPELAGEILQYTLVKATALKDMNAVYATATFSIPSRITGNQYILSSGPDGNVLMLSTSEFSANVSSPMPISGMVDSSSGRAMLIYTEGTITMRGVSD